MDPDELYTLRNRFWLGNFQMAIAEGNNLTRLPAALMVERDEFVYRCYIGLGQYNLVLSQIKDDAALPLRAVKLLAKYMSSPEASKDTVLAQLVEWSKDSSSAQNRTVQLVSALVYEKEDMMNEAFGAIHARATMEHVALYAQFCLKINRPDVAEKQLKKLMEQDEDATLTQLVSAWVNLALGGTKLADAAYAYEELIDKFEPSLSLLNGLACCKLHAHKWAEAEAHLLQALGKGQNDADTLINLITCSHHAGKSADVVSRYASQLFDAHPDHPYVVKMKRAEAQFDRVASTMAVDVK
ncbi:coatomer epsilon subunit-domain-containing protein [Pelagophyceae sp. CCMP2097]|nr:coatomer epsilon subunit-domain-containing protein [Pelagophyceae sp. CCMP2097]